MLEILKDRLQELYKHREQSVLSYNKILGHIDEVIHQINLLETKVNDEVAAEVVEEIQNIAPE